MEKKSVSLPLKLLIACTFLAMIAVNALAVFLPLNGVTPGEVSDSLPNLFAPAGITFSIWSLIYLLLAAHTLYQLGLFRDDGEPADGELLRKTGLFFSLSSLANAAWIFAWHYGWIPLSLLFMVLLLLCLVRIALLQKGKDLSARDRLLVRLPFQVYFGWITVATIANAAALLVSLGWDRFGISETVWTAAILGVGAVIGTVTLVTQRSVAYGLVLLWAYSGILIRHVSDFGFAGRYPAVIFAAAICMGAFAAAVLSTLLRENSDRRREDSAGE